MAGTTVTSSTTIGINLTLASQNPVFIATTGTIAVTGTNASAIYAAQGVTGTITNNGKLTASHGYGVRLLSGGTITNGAASITSAAIVGETYGVRLGIHGAGKVVNFGTIANTSTTTGMGVFASGSATVSNGSATDTSRLDLRLLLRRPYRRHRSLSRQLRQDQRIQHCRQRRIPARRRQRHQWQRD